MTKLASLFGENSQQALLTLRTRTFEMGGHTFKVRIPLAKELEEIQERIEKYDAAEADERFEKMTTGFKANHDIEGVVITEDDVVVDGRSTRELVKTMMQMETRITEYIKLLIGENGSLEDITYADIEAEFPTAIQLELVGKIAEVIQPGYKDARKN
jgi:hypothetical protein